MVRIRRRTSLLAFLGGLLLVLVPAPVEAKGKAKVEVAAVDWKSPKEAEKAREKRLSTEVRRAAQRSAKSLDFGPPGRVEISFVVVDVGVEKLGDIVRVSCTLVGRLKGGGRARSKLRFGGKPEDLKKLEKQVVVAATDGVMVRLSEMARARPTEG